jgi:hypothetical protein
MIFFWVPETMQRTLEELDWVFAVPVGKFARYQAFTVFPFWFKRWILLGRFWDKDAVCPPLYQFESVAASATKTASHAEQAKA